MRKLFVSNFISLDGFIERPNNDLSWFNVEEGFNQHSVDMLASVDTIVFGRKTYNVMAAYWPLADSIERNPEVAHGMNSLEKIVFTKSLKSVSWHNTRIANGTIADELLTLKQHPGKDIVILGSGTIVQECMQHNLIDEYRIIVAPIILGNGTPMFNQLPKSIPLNLLSTQVFKNGVVLLTYRLK